MESLLAHCGVALSGHKHLLFAFFLGGLTGSLTHCLTMCGPLVACKAACHNACSSKMAAASQWQYHLGRLATYSLLGFFSAFFSKQLVAYAFWPTLSSIMLVLAGIMFIGSAIFSSQHRFFAKIPHHSLLQGIAMGFMPCGLLYAALMLTAATADPFYGAVAMAFFALGTMPVLLMASSGATLLTRQWQRVLNQIGRIGMAFNGLALLAMAATFTR